MMSVGRIKTLAGYREVGLQRGGCHPRGRVSLHSYCFPSKIVPYRCVPPHLSADVALVR